MSNASENQLELMPDRHRGVDRPFVIALGASCVLHAAAVASLPGLTERAPRWPSSSLTVTFAAGPPAVEAAPAIEPAAVPRAQVAPYDAQRRQASQSPRPDRARRSSTPLPQSDRPDASARLDSTPAGASAPTTTTAESSDQGSPSATPPAVVAAAAPSAGGEAGPPIEPPRFNAAYLNNPSPDYPAVARRLGLQGTVVLRVFVDVAGRAEQLKVDQTSGASILDEVALTAVRNWRFVPARRGTEAIAHWVEVPVRFRLQD
jgi:periplasmic protein TonB